MIVGRTIGAAVAAAFVAAGIAVFLFTRDAMLAVFGLIAALLTMAFAFGIGTRAAKVQVRCTSCRALNAETSRHCGQCGGAI